MYQIYDVKTEYKNNPLGIDAAQPRFSWKITSDQKGVYQESYRIFAYSDVAQQVLLWDSGHVESQESVAVKWNGPSLVSRQRIYWNVEVNVLSATKVPVTVKSTLQWFEMGLLKETDWIAQWIEPEHEVEIDGRMPASYLRKEYDVKKGLLSARLYQTAHGLYRFWINGKEGTEDRFTPGFTSYYSRLQYQTYDITNLIHTGRNCLAVSLGDGWWRGTTGGVYRNNFGYKVGYLGQIVLTYEDGTVETIYSDTSFCTKTGGIRINDMKEGEDYDAGLEPEGWKEIGYDDSDWMPVIIETDRFAIKQNLISSRSVPVREMEEFLPKICHTPNGETVLDFGQNIAGYVRAHFTNLRKRQVITMLYGEALDKEGNFTQKNIHLFDGSRNQKVVYIAGDKREEEYCPSFSVFGFRYVLLKGYHEEFTAEDFVGVAVYSMMEKTGAFICSHSLINQLVHNSIWSQKGNFLDVPTDCPTRERSPWTGDSHIYAKTASDFMNVYSFFEKWMADLPAEQFESGKIPNIFPRTTQVHNVDEYDRLMKSAKNKSLGDKIVLKATLGSLKNGTSSDGSAGWGDTAVITPYVMYLCYGDRGILENQYSSAKGWGDYIISQAKKKSKRYCLKPWYRKPEDGIYVWDVGFHFGEWLEPLEPGKKESPLDGIRRFTSPDYCTATMYYFYSTKLLSEIAMILNKKEDALYYYQISENVKRVFNKYMIPEDGQIVKGKQAPNVRALAFDLVNAKHRKKVELALAEMIRNNGYRLNTGFLSTPYLLPVLHNAGFSEEAFKVLEQTESPSWLYNVKSGATTILETWDGYEKCEASFNHYSYGAVCNFLFEYVAGIRPDIQTPGYRKFYLKPVIGGSLTYAKAEYESPYGKIVSSWKKAGKNIQYEFVIPANSTAIIYLPVNTHRMEELKELYVDAEYKDGCFSLEIGSGSWNFFI